MSMSTSRTFSHFMTKHIRFKPSSSKVFCLGYPNPLTIQISNHKAVADLCQDCVSRGRHYIVHHTRGTLNQFTIIKTIIYFTSDVSFAFNTVIQLVLRPYLSETNEYQFFFIAILKDMKGQFFLPMEEIYEISVSIGTHTPLKTDT